MAFLGMRAACLTAPVTSRLFSINKQILSVHKSQESVAESGSPYTHFGYRQIPEEDKQSKVNEVFTNVADKYDLMNDLISAGIHRWWKDYFVRQTYAPFSFKRTNTSKDLKFLDVAGGTGDIAFRIVDYIRATTLGASTTSIPASIHVVDINSSMLSLGKKRAVEAGLVNKKDIFQLPFCPSSPASLEMLFQEGNAETLSTLPSNSFDVYTIAFGIRNCTHIDRVLKEAFRVLRPGGRFSCLEFSHVEHEWLRSLYDMYSLNVIPELGRLFANDEASYRYLVESIRRFPKQEEFCQLIRTAGFQHVAYENLSFGTVAIHSGYKDK